MSLPHLTGFAATAYPMLFGITGAILSITLAETPYIWVFLSLLLASLLSATRSRKAVPKAIWINAGFIAGTLLAVESYWTITSCMDVGNDFTMHYSNAYFTRHDVLGYGPLRDTSVTASKYYQDELLYEVNYTIDEQGLRISPPARTEASNCLLFFGGSFTFGEGVNDDESLPYRVGLQSNAQYRIYNFGFHGYGPHQMLAAIEQGLVDRIIQCKPSLIVYQGMVGHIMRSSGLTTWDSHGPRYELNENGLVEYAGHFDDTLISRFADLLRLNESMIYTKTFGTQRPINQHDVELYVGILSRAKELITSRYPGSEFHVVLWGDSRNNTFRDLVTLITQQKMNVHPRSELIPLFSRNPGLYELSAHDNHPNALAYDVVARYITTELLNCGKYMGDAKRQLLDGHRYCQDSREPASISAP